MTTDPNTVKAAQLLLHQLGVTLEDLQWTPVPVPTVAEYLPTVIAAAGPGAGRTYGTYWIRIQAAFGDRGLDQITVSDIEALLRTTMANPMMRRNSMGGISAGENLIAAMRAMYARAIADRLLPPHHNPAAHVRKPRRRPSNRRALTKAELVAINDAVTTTGNDIPLDTVLIRLHLETACRRGAAIRLRQHDLDEHGCLVRLREKNQLIRWHPVSRTLTRALAIHQHHRGTGDPSEPLLRYRDGTPLTTRRYDHLWHRISGQLPWIATHNVSTHWLRHTTITWVERHYGYGIARAYAGHTDTRGASTTSYLHAGLPELAAALAALTGEPHPLAPATTAQPGPSIGSISLAPHRQQDPKRET